MFKDAVISDCTIFRYRLLREFDDALLSGTALFVLNNPSVADANIDDATARRGMGYTKDWGYSHMWFGNTNPYRSTDPSLAEIPPEPVLAINDQHLRDMAREADIVIAAWGADANRELSIRAINVIREVADIYALAFTKKGIPRHILYLKKDLKPQLYRGKEPHNPENEDG